MERMRSEAIRGGGSFMLDARIQTRRGVNRWMRLMADVAFEHGRPVRIFGAKQDITYEKELWERLRQLAECDPLTGLANRGVFEERYHKLSKNDFSEVSIAALALIDLDRFKAINDRLGHAAGDECLRQVAIRLNRSFGDAILVARIGGDELAVLLRGPRARLEIRKMLANALHALCRPVIWGNLRIDVGTSIGAAILKRRIGKIRRSSSRKRIPRCMRRKPLAVKWSVSLEKTWTFIRVPPLCTDFPASCCNLNKLRPAATSNTSSVVTCSRRRLLGLGRLLDKHRSLDSDCRLIDERLQRAFVRRCRGQLLPL